MTRIVPRLVALILSASLVAACAETVVEVDSDAPAGGGSTPTTTVAINGTTDELLDEMAAAMSNLNNEIAAEGDQQATLAHIDAIWVVARPEVESTNPELVNGFDTTVAMSRTAVTRNRPADADRAFQILANLIDRFDNA